MKNKTLKRSLCAILAVLMIFGTLTVGAFAVESEEIELQSLPFTDVAQGAWYRPYVQAVRNQGIMQGVSSTRFAPNDTFSRGQIIATLFRIHNNRNANASDSRNNPFNDVNNNTAWYAPYVTWAHNNGISSGTSATRFGPNDHITRQEITLIMHNYVRNLTDHNSGSTATAQWNAFNDRGQITLSGAYNAFRWANNNGIVNGRNTTTLAPNGTAIRAEAAAMLVRLVGFMDSGNQQAQYFTVTFNLAGGQGNFPPQQVRSGGLVTRPTNDPTRANHIFDGWSWDFNNDRVTRNVHIVAQWRQGGGTQPPNNNLTPAQAEAEFVRLLNQHRALYGLRPVQVHSGLADVARAHSHDMVNRGFFAHTCPSGTTNSTRVWNNVALDTQLRAYFDPNGTQLSPDLSQWPNSPAYIVGEALARLGADFNNPVRALGNLLNSNAHRNILLHPNNYFIGVGLVDGHWTVKDIRPLQRVTPDLFAPGAPPARQHEFNPQ